MINKGERWTEHSFDEVQDFLEKNIAIQSVNAIDLALPSGRLWADRNVGADSPEEEGLLFTWGSIDGFKRTEGRYCGGTRNNERDWSGPYGHEHGSELGNNDNIPSNPYFDAANKYFGSPWRIASSTDYQELFNASNTTCEWKTNYNDSGINGLLVTSKGNGNSIFLPAVGSLNPTADGYNTRCRYWTLSHYGNAEAYRVYVNSSNVSNTISNMSRAYGLSVRGIREPESE